MAKISELPTKAAPTGEETVLILDAGVAKRASLATLIAAALANRLAPALAAIDDAKVAAVGFITAARDAAVTAINALIVTAQGAATAAGVARDQAIAAVDQVDIAKRIPVTVEADYAWGVTDPDGRMPLGLTHDGVTHAASIDTDDLNGVPRESFSAIKNLKQGVEISAFAIGDEAGRVPFDILPDGTVRVAALEAGTINNMDPATFAGGGGATVRKANGNYPADSVLYITMGQSPSNGSNGVVTPGQEYNNVGYPWLSAAPAGLLPLTVANTQATENGTPRGESPMYGALAMLPRLVEKEDGIRFDQHKFQMIGVNNGMSSQPIETFMKGSDVYSRVMAQIEAAYLEKQAAGETMVFGGVIWLQGEQGSPDMKNKILTLAADLDVDAKAITKQSQDATFYVCQTATNADSALAQLEAHIASPLVQLIGGMHDMDFYDAKHMNALSARCIGGRFGIFMKRVLVDGQSPEVLRRRTPIELSRNRKIASWRYHVPYGKLRWEIEQQPMQPNYGIQAVTSGGVFIPQNLPQIVGVDRVQITFPDPLPAGAQLWTALIPAVGKGLYEGGACNLADEQGFAEVFNERRMHNYAVHAKDQLVA